MSTLGMHKLSHGGKHQQDAKDCSAGFIKGGLKSNSVLAVKSKELIQSGSSNCGGSTRATARTFSSANHSTITDSHSLNLVGVNSSAVVTARSLSGKGMNLFAGHAVNDIHGVARINFRDLMPTDSEALHWVNNQQAFIEEINLGMNKDQVEDRVNNQTPGQGAEGVAPTVINNIYIDQSANCKEDAQTHYISTTWSEGFKVGHLVILSRNERRAA